MKRKSMALLLSATMMAAVVSGCSSKAPETEKQTEAKTEVKTEAAVETEAAEEVVTEAVEAEETEAVEEAVTEAAEAEETEAAEEVVTEAAEAEETEAVEEAVTEAAEAEETEAVEEAVTEAAEAEETEAVEEAVTEAAEAEETEAVEEVVTEAAESVAEAAGLEEETEEVTETAEAVTEEAVEDVAENTAVGIAELAEDAEEAVSEAVSEAAEVIEEAVEEAAEESVAESTGLEEEDTEEVSEAVEAETEAEAADLTGQSFKVGIVQFVSHASLDQIEQAIEAQLAVKAEETGADIEFTLYNGEADASNLTQIASQLISDEVDVMVAIATPAAQILQAQDEDAQIPIVFSAVTDPVGAQLVASNEEPGSFITGTSDALNTETMMNLIIANDPEITKVGLLYSNSEDSSKVPIQEAKDFLDEQGIEYVEKTGTTTDEVSQAVDALIADGVGAIFTPTDNTIMSAELTIYEKLQDAGIPHYCGADSFALNGAYLGFGVNYVELGTKTADMVVDILAGADAAAYPVATFDSGIATINTETAEKLGYDLDEKKEAFAPFCSEIVETTTAENF